jgi:hypothetical protein
LTRQLQERISLLGTAVAVLAFGITYGKTIDLLTAVGAVGLAYFIVGTLLMLYLFQRGEMKFDPEIGHPLVLPLLSLLLLWGFLSWHLSSQDWNLHAALLLVTGGFALVVVPPCLVAIAILGYRENHKTCPECANDVLSAARVCQYCGYRWQPPLPSPPPTE